MAASGSRKVILLDDDDVTALDSDRDFKLEPLKRKRLDDDHDEKIQWTDESDTVPVKPKKRRASRKSIGKHNKHSKVCADDGPVPRDELEVEGVPDYVQQRRMTFDENNKKSHESALMLPPDYTGIKFPESSNIQGLEERPVFPAQSGIVPSRPYKDIELIQSAGVIPASIAQYLRDYQVAGVAFLHRKFVYQEGGILGDDMGLGKTVQVAAFLTAAYGKTGDERDAKRMRQMRYLKDRWYPRVLIICPGSLIVNWKTELIRWGWWHVDLFHGAKKDDVLRTARAGLLEVMITTYDTYKNSRSSINMVQWDVVVADECHRLKYGSSETTKAMMEVNALCRIGLTGTAIQNKYNEFWTLLDWSNPGHFGTSKEWNDSVSKPLTVGQSHDATKAQLSLARQTAQKLVHNLLPRYFLRRMKTLIAHQLPKKTDRVVFCPLTDLQREAYENFLASKNIQLLLTVNEICQHGVAKGWCCDKYVSSGIHWQSIVFPSMIVLQKLANHLILLTPMATDADVKHKSELNTLRVCVPDIWNELYTQRDQMRNLINPEFCGKWKILKRLLKFWHSNNDKVLVFSHSVRLLRLLQHLFTNTSYSVSYIDGSLSYEARQEVVDSFNSDPDQFVFLISTKAGGVGLNITSANKVVIMDPHWNPSYDLQAQDRAYRIGQTRDVEVFRLISLGTVEESVYARQIYKQQQANIGYNASSERRYFKGVQEDAGRKGEIFGLANIFAYHPDSGLLRDIVNKTNIAEAKAGVTLMDVDMEKVAEDLSLGVAKEEDAEDGGSSQLAELLKAEDPEKVVESWQSAIKTDPVQAILTSAGVEYTHENSEVIGSSKVEEQLSRQAAMTSYAVGDAEGQNALFASSQAEMNGEAAHNVYNPPDEVLLRQFCEMAREFGFVNTTEFALVVEGWTQEARRNCLDTFYRRRLAKLVAEGLVKDENLKDEDIKEEVWSEETEGECTGENEPKKEKAKFQDLVKEGTPITKDEDNKKKEFKIKDTSTRNSIFLSDNSEDDEL